MTRCMVQCVKWVLFAKYELHDMRDVCAMHVMRAMKCMKCDMKWCEMQLEVVVRNGTLGRNCTKLIKRLLEAAPLSFEKCLTWQALNWRVCRFDPFSSLFTPKWYEWVCYEFSWQNAMRWHIKWRDMRCNAWNAGCSWNAKCATCVICVRCMWCVQWNVWNVTWNDVKCNMKWREMTHEMTCCMRACNADRSFRLHAMRCNLEFLISVICNEM